MATCASGGMGGGPGGNGGGEKRPGPSKGGKGKVKRDYRVGVKKQKYDNELKMKVIEQMDQGARNIDICRMFNIPESTVRSMRKQRDELKANLRLAKKYFGAPGAGPRKVSTVMDHSRIMIVVEHFLHKWVTRRHREGGSVIGSLIQDKARLLYAAVAKKMNKTPPPFTASRGWLHRFKQRTKCRHAIYQGEIMSADVEAATTFPDVAQQLIRDGNYTLEQVYNCD